MKPSLNRAAHFSFYWLPVIGLCTLIFWQSSFPSLREQPLFRFEDKILHMTAYALLSFLAIRALANGNLKQSAFKIRIIAVFFACIYGFSDELHQWFVPGRDASAADFLADCIGSVSGVWIYRL